MDTENIEYRTRTAPRLRSAMVLAAVLGVSAWHAQAQVETRTPHTDVRIASDAVRLAGTPEQIGTQHGARLKGAIATMIAEYIEADAMWPERRDEWLARVRRMKPSLPPWYRRELAACAQAAEVDEDVLLFAQCEGDIRSLGTHHDHDAEKLRGEGCTSYVAFGSATHDGAPEMGRNFDYWGLDSTRECVVVLAVHPDPEHGYAFVSVGWAGILGGWTLVNEKGLFVANNLRYSSAMNPQGIPTLILARIIAQKAATVDEAITLIRDLPRMRGQAFVIGHGGNLSTGMVPAGAVIAYDAAHVEIVRASEGLAFDSSIGTRPADLLRVLAHGRRKPTDAIRSAGNAITLHSVAYRPREGRLWVAHGRPAAAHLGTYTAYDLPSLLDRRRR